MEISLAIGEYFTAQASAKITSQNLNGSQTETVQRQQSQYRCAPKFLRNIWDILNSTTVQDKYFTDTCINSRAT